MIGPYITEGICRLLSFKEDVRKTVMSGFWLLHTKQDNGAGAAVLLAPQIAVTSAHNFHACLPQKSVMISPVTGTSIPVKSATLHGGDDLAILRLIKPAKEPCVEIDFETSVKTGLPVIKGRLTSLDPRVGKLETVKGIVVLDNVENLMINGDQKKSSTDVRTLFHLRSKPGDSGAGIFSKDGKLLTINNTGNGKFGVSGTAISRFRQIMKRAL